MKYTAEDIEQKIIESDRSEHEYNDVLDELYWENKEVKVNDVTLSYVASGGGEGDGAQKWVVFKVGEQLFRMIGYYSSWGDDEWDGNLEEVKAIQVEVTEYEVI